MFRGSLKNPTRQCWHMNEKAEFFLENPVRNPYTSREDPGLENDTKWTVTFTAALFSEGTQS